VWKTHKKSNAMAAEIVMWLTRKSRDKRGFKETRIVFDFD